MQVKAGKCFNTFHRISYTSFCFSLFKKRRKPMLYIKTSEGVEKTGKETERGGREEGKRKE